MRRLVAGKKSRPKLHATAAVHVHEHRQGRRALRYNTQTGPHNAVQLCSKAAAPANPGQRTVAHFSGGERGRHVALHSRLRGRRGQGRQGRRSRAAAVARGVLEGGISQLESLGQVVIGARAVAACKSSNAATETQLECAVQ